VGDRVLAKEESACGVHGIDLLPYDKLKPVNGPVPGNVIDACVVVKDVEAAETFGRATDDITHIGLGPDVARNVDCTQLLGEGGEPPAVTVG
jgi:hypothetical protein